MSVFDENPFAPPTDHESAVESDATEMSRTTVIAWVVVFILNLPIPVMFGTSSSIGMARWGMAVGCVMLLVVGIWLCAGYWGFMRQIWVGGILIALSQSYPFLHMFVGSFALAVARGTPGDGVGNPLDGIVGVMTATLITGIGLIVPAWFAGWILVAVLGPHEARRP